MTPTVEELFETYNELSAETADKIALQCINLHTQTDLNLYEAFEVVMHAYLKLFRMGL